MTLWCVNGWTEVNDYDLCITEFVRVVDQLLPVKSFFIAFALSYKRQSRTPSGTLVRVQLLGQYPTMAGRERRPCGGIRFPGGGFNLRLPVENGQR
ncbi:hypothetical protein MJ391_19480 [Escherichia coli]|nr:hypothetical protein MJ391_19480 [Escherichia coli]